MMSHPAYAAIEALDLTPVCMRLMHPHAGPGWSGERTRQAEHDYREFLFVATQFPAEAAAPAADVDMFWHFHILDTANYARDCAQAFGFTLHHWSAAMSPALRDWRTRLAASRLPIHISTVRLRGRAANAAAYHVGARPITDPLTLAKRGSPVPFPLN